MNGVCTQRSRQTKIRPIDGISQVRLVSELGDVGEPAIVGIGLAIDLPVAPLRGPPVIGDKQREVSDEFRARAVDKGVVVQSLVATALKDGNATNLFAEPCRRLPEHRPIQLVQEMTKVLPGR